MGIQLIKTFVTYKVSINLSKCNDLNTDSSSPLSDYLSYRRRQKLLSMSLTCRLKE